MRRSNRLHPPPSHTHRKSADSSPQPTPCLAPFPSTPPPPPRFPKWQQLTTAAAAQPHVCCSAASAKTEANRRCNCRSLTVSHSEAGRGPRPKSCCTQFFNLQQLKLLLVNFGVTLAKIENKAEKQFKKRPLLQSASVTLSHTHTPKIAEGDKVPFFQKLTRRCPTPHHPPAALAQQARARCIFIKSPHSGLVCSVCCAVHSSHLTAA